ncbi:MAG: glycoside hydrolase family 16 protein [Ferruginibacter sp.]|nr:glycoside hydrolase family 16 protein [Ferruginibacter sp.]
MQKKNIMSISLFLALFSLVSGCSKSGSGGGSAETAPKISISDLSLMEGNGGSTPFNFVLQLDHASSQTVTVSAAPIDGTAKAGDDYVAATQTVTFQPNETQKTVSISIVADDIKEGREDFKVVLSNPVNATIADGIADGSIDNDDTRVPFSNTGYDAPTSYPGYSLVWADEFNTPALNTANWSFENGDGCPNVCGWGNNELEFYTDRPDNLFFQDGKMIIEAKKEAYAGKNYTSSKILTRGKKTFKYGRIDFRAILPKGKGIWPAFWMLPQNNVYGGWPKSGELDIMEMIGNEPAKTYGTLHFGPGPGSTQLGRNYSLPSGLFNDAFHVFSLEWKLNQIKWLVDGVVYSTYTSADFGTNNYPFNEDFFFIINLAVGGNWPGSPDAVTTFPQWMIVDYVRVYQ